MNTKKKLFMLAVFVFGLLLLTVSGCGKTEPTVSSTGKTELTLSSTGKTLFPIKTWSRLDCASTPYVVGLKLGYFEEEGIDLIFTGETQATQQMPSILSGDNNVGDWHPNTFMVAVAGGAELVAVAEDGVDPSPDLDPKYRHMWWFVLPDSDIKSFADLADFSGKAKFSTITTNICSDFLANNILDHYGVSRDKVEWISMPDVQAVQSLSLGLIDVAGVHPPYYKAMESIGAIKIADTLDAGDLGPAAGASYHVFAKDFVEKNPEAINGFVRAIVRAQKYANEHPDDAIQWTEEHIGVPVSATHYYVTTSKIDESYLEPWLKDLEDNGVIPKGVLKVSDVVTHEFEQPDL